MASPNNNRIITNAEDWMRQQEKKLLHQERRPRITRASDLMGPGLGPRAVEINDWSGPETEFNGFFYSPPGARNSPDVDQWWIGQSISQIEGYGIQQAWDYRAVTTPILVMTRRFGLVADVRVFSAWE